MSKLTVALLIVAVAPTAWADVPECTTTTTTSTTCRGSAAPLAAPPVEGPPPVAAPYPPTPQAYYPPPGYYPPPFLPPMKSHTELRPRYGLVISGLAVFGASYMLNVAIAYVGGEGRLAIPILGPVIFGEHATRQSCSWDCSLDRSFMALMVFDSLVQAAGAVLLVAGVVSRKEVTVYDRLSIVPTVAPGAAGFAARGTF